MSQLTLTQSAVLHFIRDYQQRNGSMPTHADISSNFSWKSANAAFEQVHRLRAAGYLEPRADHSRTLRFTEKAWALLGQSQPASITPALIALPVVDPELVRRATKASQ